MFTSLGLTIMVAILGHCGNISLEFGDGGHMINKYTCRFEWPSFLEDTDEVDVIVLLRTASKVLSIGEECVLDRLGECVSGDREDVSSCSSLKLRIRAYDACYNLLTINSLRIHLKIGRTKDKSILTGL